MHHSPIPPHQPPFTLAARFLAAVESGPDRIAIEAGERSLSYAGLLAAAAPLARRLQEAGIGPERLVALCGERSLDYVVAILAVSLAGGAYLPLPVDVPAARLEQMLDDARPSVIVADGKTRSLFASRSEPWWVLEEQWAGGADGGAPPVSAASPDSLAYVMYTSGSTGVPKGVAIPQTAVVQLVCGTDYADLGPGVRILLHSALTFDAATFEIWGALLTGGTVVVMPAGKPLLQDYAQILHAKAVNTMFLTTALFRELALSDPHAFRPLRQLLTGGEVIPADPVRRVLRSNPGLTLSAVYGPTECTTFAMANSFTHADEVPDAVPLGGPIAATELRLLDGDGAPAAPGELGEIHLAGPRLARGYLNRPELTEAAFVEASDGARLYRTGDLAARDAEGRLIFRGRRDRQIKLRGFRIELEEIEAQLRSHPGVAAAAVKLVAGDGARDPLLVGYVVPEAGYSPGTTDGAAAPGAEDAAEAELTRQWRDVYSDLLYKSLAAPDQAGADPTLNTAGWKSSYDGRHIADEEMVEQVNQAVDRILALSPRNVLEIGCGTGMLLFRVAPHCESYLGTDFSQVALDYVQREVDSAGLGSMVSLSCLAADEMPEAPEGGFDTVVINSVTEHFPSLAYLDQVLRRLRPCLSPGARLYIGDNRNHALLPLFHGSVQLFRSEGDMPIARFALQVAKAVTEERQLTIDPIYFTQLHGYRCDSVQCRRGRFLNEMTAFRFDALLTYTGESPGEVAEALPASAAADDPVSLFSAAEQGSAMALGIRNARLRGGELIIDAVRGRSACATVGALRRAVEQAEAGIDPEEIWLRAASLGLAAEIRPSPESSAGDIDIRLARSPSELGAWPAAERHRPLAELANDPARSDRFSALAAALRPHLQSRLPDYAVPSFIVAMPHFALNGHGKVDLAALPLPERLRRRRSETGAAAVEDGLKTLLRRAWEAVLGLHDIEDDENFFELGGNSLKTVRLAAELRSQTGLSLSPAHIFDRPTLAGLADRLRELEAEGSRPAAAAEASRGQSRRAAVSRPRLRAEAGSLA